MPLAFWHNGNNGAQTNSLLSLDVQVAIGPWAHVYGSGILDQFTMSHEDDSTDPQAFGFIVGGTSRLPVGPGYLTGGIEYVYTNKWLYTHKYWLQTPTVTHRNTAVTRGGYTVRMIGYNQGNDFELLHGSIGYTKPGNYSLTLSYNYGVKGPYDVFMRLPQQESSDAPIIHPEGDRKTWTDAVHHQVGLTGSYTMSPSLSVGIFAYYTHITNYKHVVGDTLSNLELTLSASINLTSL